MKDFKVIHTYEQYITSMNNKIIIDNLNIRI